MSQNKYAWRPATKGDIGKLARFCNGELEIWQYGVFSDMRESGIFRYRCSKGLDHQFFAVCQVQYDIEEEP